MLTDDGRTDDGRTPDACINYKLTYEPSAQVSLKARGVGYFDTKGGYTGTGVIVRQSLQNMGIEHVNIDNPILENRVTHLKITSIETFHILLVYGQPNRTQKKRFFIYIVI